MKRAPILTGAARVFGRALSGGFENAAPHWMKALRFQASGRPKELSEAVEAAFRHFPEVDPLSLFLGVKLPSERRGSEGNEKILKVLEGVTRGPRAAWALVFRAELFNTPLFHDRDRALNDLEAAVSIAPRSAWIHAHLARALELSGRRARDESRGPGRAPVARLRMDFGLERRLAS